MLGFWPGMVSSSGSSFLLGRAAYSHDERRGRADMELVLCGRSAVQYWLTPPLLRDADALGAFSLAQLAGLGLVDEALVSCRKNESRPMDVLHNRLLSDFIGISLPVHFMVDVEENRRGNRFFTLHVRPAWLSKEHLVSLGAGISVLSPELSLLTSPWARDPIALARLMFSFCGIYSVFRGTNRANLLLRELNTQGELSRIVRDAPKLYGYSDAAGKPLQFTDSDGDRLPWIPVFDRKGALTDLWQRPPLTSVEALEETSRSLEGVRGIKAARRALSLVVNGSGSPEETRAVLMLCSGAWNGAEAWSRPSLNRRIDLSPEARQLAGTAYCIGDLVWADKKRVLEVQGMAHHADQSGFYIQAGRRPALESMGWEVAEIVPLQLSDLNQFDILLPSLAARMGEPLQRKTPAFLARRAAFHEKLYGTSSQEEEGERSAEVVS